MYTFVPDIDIQQMRTILFDQEIDLLLSLILKWRRKAVYPKLRVLRYLVRRKFTGETLDKRESVIFNLLRNEKRQICTSYLIYGKMGNEESPITVEVVVYS